MPTYDVEWLIQIDADDPASAAREALDIHRDPESVATVFTVTAPDGSSVTIDLTPEAG